MDDDSLMLSGSMERLANLQTLLISAEGADMLAAIGDVDKETIQKKRIEYLRVCALICVSSVCCACVSTDCKFCVETVLSHCYFLQAQIAQISGDIAQAKRVMRPDSQRGPNSFSSPADALSVGPASSPASGEDYIVSKKKKARHGEGSTTSASELSSPPNHVCKTGSGNIAHLSWSKEELDTMAGAVENETGFSHQT